MEPPCEQSTSAGSLIGNPLWFGQSFHIGSTRYIKKCGVLVWNIISAAMNIVSTIILVAVLILIMLQHENSYSAKAKNAAPAPSSALVSS
jgi:hypothetical protein